ncbi:hypothetical protein TWF481_001840 [Arthrobotrys musiformis]|uniref:DUF4246 domain-containing protein n=1 Tax=Arthrobotrys musiformis TaxID=47236 RepID=A0AAV9VW89_9PEZI
MPNSSMKKRCYPHPSDEDFEFPARYPSKKEDALLCLSRRYREEPNWTATITKNLTKGFIERLRKLDPHVDDYLKTRHDITFMLKELKAYKCFIETLPPEYKGVEPDIDGVWRMDGVLDEVWRQRLCDAVSILENTPNEERGWPTDPAPSHMTRDLLDPYMYANVPGKTKIPEIPEWITPQASSLPYPIGFIYTGVWLPSEFQISENNNSTKILSYINNLTLQGPDLLFHPILERIFTNMVPLFDYALADLENCGWERKRAVWDFNYFPESYFYHHDDDDDDDDDEYAPGGKGKSKKNPIIDKEKFMDPWTAPDVASSEKLQGKTVKVVVRMVETKLTPEHPVCLDGDYEPDLYGMQKERIVATGVYLYAQENITNPSIRLSHRDLHPDKWEKFRWMTAESSINGDEIEDIVFDRLIKRLIGDTLMKVIQTPTLLPTRSLYKKWMLFGFLFFPLSIIAALGGLTLCQLV